MPYTTDNPLTAEETRALRRKLLGWYRKHQRAMPWRSTDGHRPDPYHTLVIPKAHYTNVFDAPAEVLADVMMAAKDVIQLYQEKLGLTDLQIVSSAGADGQQDVFHLHVHIVPRHRGDGQNIRWKIHPELRARFDGMLAALR